MKMSEVKEELDAFTAAIKDDTLSEIDGVGDVLDGLYDTLVENLTQGQPDSTIHNGTSPRLMKLINQVVQDSHGLYRPGKGESEEDFIKAQLGPTFSYE